MVRSITLADVAKCDLSYISKGLIVFRMNTGKVIIFQNVAMYPLDLDKQIERGLFNKTD